MSRQRLRESNIKWDIKLSSESFALKIIKLVELKSIESKSKIVKILINQKIKNFIQENYSNDINYFKKKNKINIELISDNSLSLSDYILEFLSKTNKVIDKIERISHLKKIILNKEQNDNGKKNLKKTNLRKKKYFKKKTK
jgi:ribonuclease E